MEAWNVIALALIQGLTEFLPISSSAHLALFPQLTGSADQGLAFDVALHLGTLTAVVLYFRRELLAMVLPGNRPDARLQRRIGLYVLFGTIPVGIAGLLLHDVVEQALRSTAVIAWASIGFGLLLFFADRFGSRRRGEAGLGWRDALWIGCAQALALIPGTSRSGVTMTAALALGLDARTAARFSFLLSIPVIALAGGLQTLKLLQHPEPVAWGVLGTGALLAAASAFACIHLFLKLLDRIGFMPFVVYRVVLGVVLLVWLA